jgi:hypothetical protein
VLSVAWSPFFQTPVSPAAVSVTFASGSTPCRPSFHAATSATACLAAALGVPPFSKSPRTEMPDE